MQVNYPVDSIRLAEPAMLLGLPGDLAVASASRDHWLIRIEGTLTTNGSANPGAAALLRAMAGRYSLVSSNSRDTGRTMAAKFKRMGMDVPEQGIVLAGEEALRLVAARFPGARCLVMASRVLAHAARSLGLQLVADNAEVILLGRDSAWTYKDLMLVANELARGCRLVVSNGDMAYTGKGGRIIPDTGALLAAIEATAGPTAIGAATGSAAATIVRLSRAAVLRTALARLGVEGNRAWLLSDSATDVDTAATIEGLRLLHWQPELHGNLAALADSVGRGAPEEAVLGACA